MKTKQNTTLVINMRKIGSQWLPVYWLGNWKTESGRATNCDCVVPENIQAPTTEGIGNSRGMGGSEAQEIPEGKGVGP